MGALANILKPTSLICHRAYKSGSPDLNEALDPPIADRARELRDYYVTHPIGRRSLSTPDAIHLATALIHGAEIFHTFDNGKSKDDKGKKGIPLLELKDKVAGHLLEIRTPFIAFTPELIEKASDEKERK